MTAASGPTDKQVGPAGGESVQGRRRGQDRLRVAEGSETAMPQVENGEPAVPARRRSGRPAPVLRAAGDPATDAGVCDAVSRAAAALQAGQAVVLPTDTVYGVAAIPSSAVGVGRLFALKGRAATQPFAVLVSGPSQALELVTAGGATDRLRTVMERFWPGALTLVLPRRAQLAHLGLGGDPATIGIRCPASPVVRALADLVGPVATTSANRSGEPTPVEAGEAAATLLGDVALVLDGGRLDGAPSTVIDATVEPWRLLREGPVTLSSVQDVAR